MATIESGRRFQPSEANVIFSNDGSEHKNKKSSLGPVSMLGIKCELDFFYWVRFFPLCGCVSVCVSVYLFVCMSVCKVFLVSGISLANLQPPCMASRATGC